MTAYRRKRLAELACRTNRTPYGVPGNAILMVGGLLLALLLVIWHVHGPIG